MRPVELELEGLHSYRERQRIDFRRLGERGLFGIFGPTGSGKSTLLDAMTLALYGEVARASSNQGILNTDSKSVFVALSFEAGDGAVWRVERSYRRRKEGDGLDSKAVRLLCQEGTTWRVDAEGANAVGARVEEIIGLEGQDFMRAVVLPQGRFAEFLQLQGAKRRAMLERILNLERYGDRLYKSVVARLRVVQGELRERTGGVDQLAHATPEAVEQARVEADAALATAVAEEQRLKEDSAALAAAREVRQLQQELRDLQWRREELAAQEPAIAAKRAELGAAERAEVVRVVLSDAAKAEAELTAAKQALEAAGAAEQAAAEALAAARARTEAAVRERAERSPELGRRRDALRDGRALERELSESGARLREVRTEWERRQQAQAAAVRQAATQEAARVALAKEAQAGRERLAQVRVDPAQRERVQAAAEALRRLREAEARGQAAVARSAEREKARGEQAAAVEEAARTVARHQAESQALAEQREAHEARSPGDERTLREAVQQSARLERVVEAVAQAEAERSRAEARLREEESARETAGKAHARAEEQGREADRQLALARERVAEARRAEDEAVRRGLAGRLAASLVPGAPCPVCGATDHPAKASDEDAAVAEQARKVREEAEAAAERCAAAASRAREHVAATGAERERRQASCAEVARVLAEAGGVLTGARAELPEARREESLEALREWLASERAAIQSRVEARDGWETQRRKLEAAAAKLAPALAKAEAELAGGRARAEAAVQAATEAREEAARTARESGELREHFESLRGDLLPEAVERERAGLDARDREAAQLEQRLRGTEARLQEALERAGTARAEAERLAVGVAEQALRLEEEQQRSAGLQARLAELTGGRPVQALLEECERNLQGLADAELSAREQERSAEAENTRCHAEHGKEAARHRAAVLRTRETDQRKRAELANRGFGSEAAARRALREPRQCRLLSEEIEAFVQKVRETEGALSEARARLGERGIPDEAWVAIQQRHEQAEQRARAARSEAGQRTERHARLRADHEKLGALLEERAKLQPQCDRLERLGKLLEARALVDFMAEQEIDSIARDASARLMTLTQDRYELVPSRQEGRSTEFRVRDNHNGGVERPVSSLSGGETFLASLSLALALSMQIQLRGERPLRFFFLDEGFGTLDPALLDTALTALERLQREDLTVGVITHVEEVRTRLPRRLVVAPARAGGQGSRVVLEEG